MKTFFELEAGTVTTKKEDEVLKFLIIFRKKTNDYTLPKGHVEEGEGLEEAAVRETFEETGYNTKITQPIDSFEYTVKEQKNGEEVRIIRRVYNFLAKVTGGDSDGKNIDENEGDMEIMWLPYEEACDRVTYEDNKIFLKKSHEIIQNLEKGMTQKDFNTISNRVYEEIVKKIKESDFYDDVLKVGLLGSTNDGEAIRTWSDLDMLLILKSDEYGNVVPETIMKIRLLHKELNYLYPQVEISFLTHTYYDLEKYVSYSYLETYQFASFKIDKDGVDFQKYLLGLIQKRGITPEMKKRYAVYYLRHLRFNLLRKVASEDLFDNKKTLKRIIDEIVRIMTIYSDYYNIRVQGKKRILETLKKHIEDKTILDILEEAVALRFSWFDVGRVENEEILSWVKKLSVLENLILKQNIYSVPEEFIGLNEPPDIT